ncbi:MAG: metallophosphoesterase family protein [Candidatus Latescibacteria bacterium]|nr:metallophosphoesterase family protein [Candidatus Latescibacterota bacterium]
MRYGIISDIHGNLEALNAVLEHLSKERIDRYVCLGDLVGYGANPNESVALVRTLTDWVIAGNHDWVAVGLSDRRAFNPHASNAALWTARCLTEEHRSYLCNLPLKRADGDALFVHSTPEEPERWRYILSAQEAGKHFDVLNAQICFIGHSHRPVVFARNDEEHVLVLGTDFRIKSHWKYIANVGSVGQPRDGDPRASYAVFDAEEASVRVKRVRYDVKKAQQKIRAAGLPDIEAERLAYGE